MALLEVARIAKAHGLRGEVVVELFTDRTERLAPGSRLVVAQRRTGRDDGEDEPGRTLEVVAARPFQHRFLVTFGDVATREEAEALHGAVLLAAPIEDADALFVHELIGAELVDQTGVVRGRVTAVEANPASDLLVVDDRYLVPVRFVTARSPGRVEVEVPAGLFEP